MCLVRFFLLKKSAGQCGHLNAASEGHHVGIALYDIDRLTIDAQGLAENLSISGTVALAMGEGAYHHIDSTVFSNTDYGLFLRPTTAGFHVEAYASAPK